MKNKIKAVIRKILGNKKGSAMIEYTIGLLLFVSLICFLFDVIIIAQKQYIVSQQTNVIVRDLGVQGGIYSVMPTGFPGTNKNYITSGELYNGVKKHLEDAGLSTSNKDWDVEIKTYNKSGSIASLSTLDSSTKVYADYGTPIDVTIYYKYSWTLWGQIVPGLSEIKTSTSRHSVSEFKYNYDSWDGEH